MDVIVHYPQDKCDLDTLKKQVAVLHGEYIYSYLSKLDIPAIEKVEFVKGIKDVLE
jgi:hypothetical protein